MRGLRTLPTAALICLVLAACASRPAPAPTGPYPYPGPIGEPTGPAAAEAPRIARLTGGIGNQVVDSFDQNRVGVARIRRPIDHCYASTAAQGGWRTYEIAARTLPDDSVALEGWVISADVGEGLKPARMLARIEGVDSGQNKMPKNS